MGRRLPLALLLAVVALAGCGGSKSASTTQASTSGEASKTAPAILADARRVALAAKSVHIVAAVHNAQEKISLDLNVAQRSGGGTMTLDGSKVDVVRVGQTTYIRAEAKLFVQFGAGASAAKLAGKWFKVPTSTQRFAELVSLTDLYAFLTQSLTTKGSVTKGAVKTVDGKQAIELKSKHGGSVFVATSGTPYPLRFTSRVSPAGTVSLRDWNAAKVPSAPTHALSIGALGK